VTSKKIFFFLIDFAIIYLSLDYTPSVRKVPGLSLKKIEKN